MPDLAAPYIQRGIVEMLLLAVIAGVLGTWVVLRRLPFYTHAIGTATFPGLVVAGPWGVPAQLTALVCAVGFGGVLERLQRTRRIDPDAAIGLLLVAALAIGVVLASDVYHSGAGVDRLLFGSLIALTPLDLWLTAAAAVGGAGVPTRALRRSWLATGFDPDRRPRRRRARRRWPTARCCVAVAVAVVVALDAVGALLVTVVLTVPAATVRLFEPALRTQQLATFGADRGRGRSPRSCIADALQRRPGPGAGGARRARLRRSPRGAARSARDAPATPVQGGGVTVLVDVRDLRGGYVRGADVLGGVDFAVAPGEIVAVLGPNGGGKTTLFRALLGELPFRTRRGRARRAAGVRAADRGRAARLPGQRARRRADGRVRAHAVVQAGGAGGPRARPTRRSSASGSPTARTTASGRSRGGQRQRVLIARALVQDAPVLLLDEPLSGVDRPSAAQIERVFGELQAEGRALLVATHDVAQARAWPRVLCLNHGQVAFGAPEQVLDAPTCCARPTATSS